MLTASRNAQSPRGSIIAKGSTVSWSLVMSCVCPGLSVGRNLTIVLVALAFDPGPIDGNFGPRTESAVRAYQTQQNIGVDGIVGDQTWWTPAGAAGATLASIAGLVTA